MELELTALTVKKILAKVRIVLIFFTAGMVGSFAAYKIGWGLSKLIAATAGLNGLDTTSVPNKLILQSGILGAFLRMVIWAPLVEETLFRLWQRYSVRNIILSLSALAVFVSIQVARISASVVSNVVIFNWLLFLIFLSSFFILWSFRSKFPVSMRINQPSAMIISSLIFGLIHLTNYDLAHNSWIVCLPMVLPQVFTGFLFSILRMRYGYIYGIIVHALLNLTSLAAALV